MTNTCICVFTSSSNSLSQEYYDIARELGVLIAQNGFDIVYGGSRRGMMYACASAVKEFGGKVLGIMPKKIADFGCANPEDCDEFYLTEGMRERKGLLDEKSDAVIALPGGYGTLEEISEMIVQKQLGYNNKPIVILNTNNFYKGVLEFFDNLIAQNFAHEGSKKLYYVASTPKEAIEYIKTYKAEEINSKYAIK